MGTQNRTSLGLGRMVCATSKLRCEGQVTGSQRRGVGDTLFSHDFHVQRSWGQPTRAVSEPESGDLRSMIEFLPHWLAVKSLQGHCE